MRYEFYSPYKIKNCWECKLKNHRHACKLENHIVTSKTERPLDCPMKEFNDRRKPVRLSPRPPYDLDYLKPEEMEGGVRVVTTGNSPSSFSAGHKGTILDPNHKEGIEVLFDEEGYFSGRNEDNRTYYMYHTSLKKLKEE